MRRQSGQGKIGCIFWILVFGIASLAAYKMLPVKIKSAELYDFMDETAQFSARKPVDRIRKGIVSKAEELGLPVDEKNVKVEKQGRKIKMEVKYTVPVEFPGYTYQWEFHHQLTRDIFII